MRLGACLTLLGVTLVLGASPAAAQTSELPLLPPGGFPGLLPPFPTSNNPQPGPVPNCSRASVACVESLIARMRSLRDRLGCDHRAVFLTTYLTVTEETLHSLRQQPPFYDDNEWLTYLTIVFSNYYFRAFSQYAAGQPVPEAWRMSFDTAARGDAAAVEDMLLGINAHVQRDEAYAISEVGVRMPDGRTRKPDNDRFNIVLERSYQRIIREIRDRYDPTIEDTNPSGVPADDVAGQSVVAVWREEVWRNAERLLNARNEAEYRQVAESIEANAANSARGIMANPDRPGHRAFRDAYCRARLRAGSSGRGLLEIRLRARPGTVRTGVRRVRFTATTTAGGEDARSPVRGALVRFAGRRARTNSRGQAVIRARLRRAGRHGARATKSGLRAGRTSVRARRAQRSSPRFTG